MYLKGTNSDIWNQSWIDILQDFGDAFSLVSDIIAPGSGSVIDIVNAIVYFLRAYFEKDSRKRGVLCTLGLINVAAVFMLGPGQAYAMTLKRVAKGQPVKSPGKVSRALSYLWNNLNRFINWIKGNISNFLIHPHLLWVARKLFGNQAVVQLRVFSKWIGEGTSMAKNGIDEMVDALPKKKGAIIRSLTPGRVAGKTLGQAVGPEVVDATIKNLKYPVRAMKWSGFVAGKTYNYIDEAGELLQFTITGIGSQAVTGTVRNKLTGELLNRTVNIHHFMDNAVGKFIRGEPLTLFKRIPIPRGKVLAFYLTKYWYKGLYYENGKWNFNEKVTSETPADPNKVALTPEEVKQKKFTNDDPVTHINNVYGKNFGATTLNDPEVLDFLNELRVKYDYTPKNKVGDMTLIILIRDLLKKNKMKVAKDIAIFMSDKNRNEMLSILNQNISDASKRIDVIIKNNRK